MDRDDGRGVEGEGRAGSPPERDETAAARNRALGERDEARQQRDRVRFERNRALTEAQESKEQTELYELFIGALGHDLRGPLTAISTAAQLLGRPGITPDVQAKAAQRIQKGAQRIDRMIQQLLDLTRARVGGGIPLERNFMDLHDLARVAIEETRAGFPDRVLRLETTGEGVGEWDRERLHQVLGNLIMNALQHGRGDVLVRIAAEDETVVLEVTNQGEPIPPALLPELFEPFRRGQRRGSREGLGLGLYIVQQLVLAHGGTIDVSSSEDTTTFTVRLPRYASGR